MHIKQSIYRVLTVIAFLIFQHWVKRYKYCRIPKNITFQILRYASILFVIHTFYRYAYYRFHMACNFTKIWNCTKWWSLDVKKRENWNFKNNVHVAWRDSTLLLFWNEWRFILTIFLTLITPFTLFSISHRRGNY